MLNSDLSFDEQKAIDSVPDWEKAKHFSDLQTSGLCPHSVDKWDSVNHPRHYKSHPSGIEIIKITEHMNFCLGNAVKYIMRAGVKTECPVEDLRKAVWYLQREIERINSSKGK